MLYHISKQCHLGLWSQFLPNWNSGIFHLDPPGFGGKDRFAVDFQPGSNTPEPLLEHGGDGPIGSGANVEKIVPSESHGADHILRQNEEQSETNED